MKDEKMTLQQYIESRNYKRRLLSNSKSKQKIPVFNQNPSIAKFVPSPINSPRNPNPVQKIPQMSQLANQLKKIDETNESFSLIHKKVEAIKQFVRQFIQNDNIFVNFCKKMFDLQSCYRLELIQAYRYQLFRYQFENKNMMDEQKKKILKQLNEFYMNRKFQYKKIILKEQDTKKVQQKRGIKQVKGGPLNRQVSLQKDTFPSESRLPITSQVKTGRVLDYNVFTNAIYRMKDQIQEPENKYNNPKTSSYARQQEDGIRYTKSSSSKKVVFIANSPVQESTKQYEIPDFSPFNKPITYNPQNHQQDEQSNIDIESQAQSDGFDTKNMLKYLSKQSLEDTNFQFKQCMPQTNLKQNKREQPKLKKTFRQVQLQKQRQKLFQSKDYLKVQKR